MHIKQKCYLIIFSAQQFHIEIWAAVT